jgi:hypothetical protein
LQEYHQEYNQEYHQEYHQEEEESPESVYSEFIHQCDSLVVI